MRAHQLRNFWKAQWSGFKIQIFLQFPAMNRFQNLDFSAFPAIFKGQAHPKKSWNLDFSMFSWDFGGWACPKFFKTWTSPQFSWDFEETDPPQKISEPANLSTVFLGIWRDGPTQKIKQTHEFHWTASEPANFTGSQTQQPWGVKSTPKLLQLTAIASSWDLSVLDGLFKKNPQIHSGSILDCQLGIRREDGSIILTIDYCTFKCLILLMPLCWHLIVSMSINRTPREPQRHQLQEGTCGIMAIP